MDDHRLAELGNDYRLCLAIQPLGCAGNTRGSYIVSPFRCRPRCSQLGLLLGIRGTPGTRWMGRGPLRCQVDILVVLPVLVPCVSRDCAGALGGAVDCFADTCWCRGISCGAGELSMDSPEFRRTRARAGCWPVHDGYQD